jgi:AhpD family alkylhydroperoxidase
MLGLGETSIAGKYKQLIGLAVASQTPSAECVAFYTVTARLMGASEQEVKEAVAMAALTRKWSTWLNGMQVDEAQFRKETDGMLKYIRSKMAQR